MLIPSCCYGLQHDFACINIWKDQINIVSAKLERFTRYRRREKSNCNRLLIRRIAAVPVATTYNLFMLPPVPLNFGFLQCGFKHFRHAFVVYNFSNLVSASLQHAWDKYNIQFQLALVALHAPKACMQPRQCGVNSTRRKKKSRKIGIANIPHWMRQIKRVSAVDTWQIIIEIESVFGQRPNDGKNARDAMLVAILLSYGNHKIELLVWLVPINWNASCVRNRTTAHLITSHRVMQRRWRSMAH